MSGVFSKLVGLSFGNIGDGDGKSPCEEDEGRSCGEGDGTRYCYPVLPSHSFCDTLHYFDIPKV